MNVPAAHDPVKPDPTEQDYIPGTRVIKNLVGRDAAHPDGTADQRMLDQAENMFVSDRLNQLSQSHEKPVASTFTFGHMREIHKHLFQDVYAWAGEPRRVPMQKHDTNYAGPAEMNALLRQQYARLAEQNYLRGINDREEFTLKLASIWAEINHGHAFREGNTRAQGVFFTQLAENAGWNLDISRLSPHHERSVYQPFVDARFEHQRIRGTDALSSQDAALDLANVLLHLVEPDNSLEGRIRRGDSSLDTGKPAEPEHATSNNTAPNELATRAAVASTRAARAALHARNPELREMKLDRYGLDPASNQELDPVTTDEHQP
jgi:cell filamentation protein